MNKISMKNILAVAGCICVFIGALGGTSWLTPVGIVLIGIAVVVSNG